MLPVTVASKSFYEASAVFQNIVRSFCLGYHSRCRLRLIVIHVPLQFADSWSACITQSQSSCPPSSNSAHTSSSNPQMKSFRGVVDTLTNFLLNPPKDAGHRKLQVSCSLLTTEVFFCCVTPRSLVILEGHGCVTKFQLKRF